MLRFASISSERENQRKIHLKMKCISLIAKLFKLEKFSCAKSCELKYYVWKVYKVFGNFKMYGMK